MTDVELEFEPDPEIMLQVAVKIEECTDRDGWDGPPVAGYIYTERHAETDSLYRRLMRADPNLPRPARVGDVWAQPVLGAQFFSLAQQARRDAPPKALFGLALRLAYGTEEPSRQVRATLSMPGVLGFYMASETWTVVRHTDEPAMVGRPSEQPDRMDSRSVMVVDRRHRAYSANRLRGYEGVQAMRGGVSGSVVQVLRMLVDCANDQVPPQGLFQVRYDALERADPAVDPGVADPASWPKPARR